MHSENWDDMRYVLAVADHGTVSAAARSLGVNHATVLRRIAAFEERYGAPVFRRTPTGYAVLPDKLRMLEAARDVGRAMRSVENILRGIHAPLTGQVRITSTDTLCRGVLPGILSGFPEREQGLHLSLISTNAHLDFSRAHADITVRPAAKLASNLTGVPAARLGFAVFGPKGGSDNWLGLAGALGGAVVGNWLRREVPENRIVASADSFLALATMVQQGMGNAVLPSFIGEATPGLVRREPGPELPMATLWVACHVEMAEVSRIAVTMDYLVEKLKARGEWLETGRNAPFSG